MAKGMARKIDELGRVVIPKEIRDTFRVGEKPLVSMFVSNGILQLQFVDSSFHGIARNLDELGRVTLPIEVRRSLGLPEGQKVDVYVEGNTICIRKEGCFICGSTEGIFEVEGILICIKCAFKIVEVLAEGDYKDELLSCLS